jgi:hypothetical protein
VERDVPDLAVLDTLEHAVLAQARFRMFSNLREIVVAIATVKTADMTDSVAQVGPRDKADFVTPHLEQGPLAQQSDVVGTDYPLSDHTFQ